MVKVDVPPSISKEAVLRVLQKTDKAEMDSYSEERNPDKKLLEIETYKFSQKNVVTCSATMKHKIIQTLQTWIGYVAIFGKLPCPLVSAISVISNVLPYITKLYKYG